MSKRMPHYPRRNRCMSEASEERNTLPTQEDYDAIVRAIKDYAEGWYDGDSDRMSRSLHPDLVKRTIMSGSEQGTWKLRRPSTYEGMVNATKEGGGREVPASERRYQIDVLDVFRHVAIARCVSPLYVDYIHLAKFGSQQWLIVDVLWEVRRGAYNPEG